MKRQSDFDVRKTQLLTPFGIGSLMDINNQSVIIADSEYWDEQGARDTVTDVRLQNALNASGFISPPVPIESDYIQDYETITAKRFPKWYFSPTSRELKPIAKWEKEIASLKDEKYRNQFAKKPITVIRNGKKNSEELSPVRLFCACDHGHLQDFPWSEWVHQDSDISKEQALSHTLFLKSMGNSTSIGELIVKCKECDKTKNLNGIFNSATLPKKLEKMGVKCEARHIWKKEGEFMEPCDRPLQVLLRSQSNIYYPAIRSSLNIPSELDSLIQKIKNHPQFIRIQEKIRSTIESDKKKEFESNRIKGWIADISDDLSKSEGEIKLELSNYLFSDDIGFMNDEQSIMSYRWEEFQLLSGRKKLQKTNEINFDIDLVKKEKYIDYKFSNLISGITLVHSLEVVSALTGFTRIYTYDSDDMLIEKGENESNDVKFVSLKRKDNKYVAVKNNGEGIFIELSAKEIQNWIEKIKGTSIEKKIESRKNHIQYEDQLQYINLKYILLHTLSHLLIKELTNSSGYSSSSLKERVYYSDDIGKEMAGILIYTSSSDIGGTLGGLVKQGLPQNLFSAIDQAIENAKWCSFDPTCIDNSGQGKNSLNIAACHACGLISETSCENQNIYLDRNVIIGSIENPELGFFRN